MRLAYRSMAACLLLDDTHPELAIVARLVALGGNFARNIQHDRNGEAVMLPGEPNQTLAGLWLH